MYFIRLGMENSAEGGLLKMLFAQFNGTLSELGNEMYENFGPGLFGKLLKAFVGGGGTTA